MQLCERHKCKNKTGIYKITNVATGTAYVGQALNISMRIYQHLHSAISDRASDYEYPLHRAMRKYGTDSFIFDILEECPKEALNEREIHWISFYDTFKNGYNQTAGGSQSIRKIKLSDADVEQIWDRLLNTQDSFTSIADDFGITIYMVGRINHGVCWNNKNFVYPLRANNHAIQIKNRLNTGLGVYQLDKNTGEVLNIFVSAMQAALAIGDAAKRPHIVKCLSGKRSSAYGYLWESRPITDEQFKELLKRSSVNDTVKSFA